MRHPGRSDGIERVTIEDVAAAARVSTATVSRYLAHPERVSDRLAQQVHAAVEKLRYVPNASARALSSLRSGLVGVVAAGLDEHASLIASLSDELAAEGRCLVLREASTAGRATDAVRALADRDVEAVLAIGIGLPPEARAMLAVRAIRWLEWVDSAGVAGDAFAELRRAASEVVVGVLQSLGHRCLAIAGTGPYIDAVKAGWPGEVLDHDGLGAESGALIAGRGGDAAAPTVLVCDSDARAAAVLSACRRLEVRIPEDLSVLGFGDRPLGLWTLPPLATLRLPVAAVGAWLASALVNGGAAPAIARPKLVLRRSLGASRGFT